MKILFLFGLLAVVCGQLSPVYSFEDDDTSQGVTPFDPNRFVIMTHDDVLNFFRKQDANGDGFVSFAEYKATRPNTVPKQIINGEFRFYDKLDGVRDLRISLAAAAGYESILDPNGDGVISYVEYVQNMPRVEDGVIKEINSTCDWMKLS
ncbi:uncharacterized protein LOC112567590 [Pomacea canaliculata]|uniref:uncharacterized protein LOC112567590 n=1 Tax=Pomacea canaliculata TaxID=400727 RepID=UPI000D72576E|nr:uncharacterized protein LOC112567590 [Pomacea canaliculata]